MDLIEGSLERLDYLEQQGSCSASLKDQINTLKIELRFLRTFFMSAKLNYSVDLFEKIETRRDVVEDILSLGGGEVPIDLDRSLFSVQEKIELIKLQVHEYYYFFNLSDPCWDIEGDLQVNCIDWVLENMNDLIQSKLNCIVGVEKLINTLGRRLIFLRNSLQFVAKFQLSQNASYHLKEEVGYAATRAASFFFSCWINKTDEYSDFSLALRYTANRSEDTSLYQGILKASESLTSDATVCLLVGFIDFLLERLAELQLQSVEIPTKNHFESLRQDLNVFRSFLRIDTTTNPHPYHVKLHGLNIGAQLNKVARLIEDWLVIDMSEELMLRHKMLPWLGKRKLISFLCIGNLVNDETSSVPHIKDQLEILREDIRLLRTFYVQTQNGDQEIKNIRRHMKVMALEAGTAIYSFHVNEDKEDMAKEMSSLLPDLLEKIKLIKADMRKISFRDISSNFQETRGQRGTATFLKDLTELLNFRAGGISLFVKPDVKKAAKLWIETLQNELKFLISEEHWIEIEELEALEIRITNIANEATNVADHIFLNNHPLWYPMLKFHTAMEEVELIKKKIQRINPKISGEKWSAMREVVVGFEDETKSIIEQLIEQINIFSIIKIGGLRKTTLVKKLEDLVNHETSSMAPIKDQLEILCEDIRLLRTFYDETQNGDHVHRKIHRLVEDIALDARSAIYSFYVNEEKEGKAKEMSNLLTDLLEKIKLIKADMRKIYSRATSSNFRETCGPRGTANSLKELNQLLNRRAAIISGSVEPHIEKAAKLWIKTLQDEVQSLISFLDNSEEQWIEIGEQEALEKRITNMAHEAKEYAAEPVCLREDPFWYCTLKFLDVMEEAKQIKKEIERINQKISADKLSAMREVIVGFKDEAKNIIEQLIEGPGQLNIVSIIGMGGLGKTTLVRKLYCNPSVVEYFDVRAWCCVSQLFDKRQVLRDILSHVDECIKDINVGSDEDLAKKLYQSLKGRRYLIVIDDIWEIEAWDAIRRCFCDDKIGSRIIFTTRIQEIASKVRERSNRHILRRFSDDESLELLQKKLFRGKRCPTEQLEIVKQIAEDCKGLPLAVVLMAGVLEGKEKEERKQIAQRLRQHTDGDLQKLSKEVMEWSYKNLPEHLKTCFLYLGMFPEDKEILAKKVRWLWAAEGFIQKTEQKSSENVAEDYLMDLIGRSLVIIAERGSSGAVKTFRIHDLLRSFSLAKAKEEKSLLLLDGNDEPFVATNLKFCQQVDGNVESYNSNPTTYEQYRLCIYSMLDDMQKLSSSSHICSLLHFAPSQLDITSPYDASFIFSNFKLLNVLDLGRLLLKDLNCEIEMLVQLRLLAVQIRSNSIPSSIANMKNLETFLVKGIRGEVDVPNTIWSMVSLRHLHIDNRASLLWDKSDVTNSVSNKLETLSTPILSYGTKSRDLIRSLSKLQKLKCIFAEFWSNTESCNIFPELDSLVELESLKVFYYGKRVSHGRFNFPSNLKKLTLSKFRLPWSDIATIARLPNLEVLKLLFKAFDGKEWETRDDEFPKLKYLKLESLDIEQWNISSEEHFPVLEKLVVHRCKQLDEIPSIVGDINTLQMIEVKWCNPSAANSAKKIYQEQQEYGNEGLEVIIHPYQGRTSSS